MTRIIVSLHPSMQMWHHQQSGLVPKV